MDRITNAVRFVASCCLVWASSTALFALIALGRPDLDVLAGAGAMTIMYLVCALTAVAVSAADQRNT